MYGPHHTPYTKRCRIGLKSSSQTHLCARISHALPWQVAAQPAVQEVPEAETQGSAGEDGHQPAVQAYQPAPGCRRGVEAGTQSRTAMAMRSSRRVRGLVRTHTVLPCQAGRSEARLPGLDVLLERRRPGADHRVDSKPNAYEAGRSLSAAG